MVLWGKNFSTENRDKNLKNMNFFFGPKQGNTKGFHNESFQQRETNNSRQKFLILPLFIHWLFCYRKDSETQHRRVTLRNVSALWDNKFFHGKSWQPPPLPTTLSSILFRYPKLMKDWRVRLQIFRHCGTKFFRGKSWYFPPPLIHKLFRNQKNSETQHRGVPLRNASVPCDKNFSRENLDTSLSFLSRNFFANRNFLKPST